MSRKFLNDTCANELSQMSSYILKTLMSKPGSSDYIVYNTNKSTSSILHSSDICI